MKNKLGITEGKYIEQDYRSYSGSVVIRVIRDGFDNTAEDVLTINGYQRTKNEIEGTLKVVLDSLQTTNKCGKLPSTLLQENEEMKSMLIDALGYVLHIDLRENIKQLLTKINK